MNEKLTVPLQERTEKDAQAESWSEVVILADADYIDHVAFNLIVNFERMLERRIPQADLTRWLDCVALDGGIRPSAERQDMPHSIQVILLHKEKEMKNFQPASFADLDGKAFSDSLGEFCISCVKVEELTTMGDLFVESLQHICQQQEVKHLMVIPNAEDSAIYNKVRETLNHIGNDEKRITVFAMQPLQGGRFCQEILGYSLMAALGIRAEEIERKG